MAEQRTSILLEGEPTINAYEFDERLLTNGVLKVLTFETYSVELTNRDFHVKQPFHDYDVVFGPIADDGVTFQLRRYKAGVITMEELVEELKYSRGVTFQYFFGTELAISKLRKI